MLFPRNRWPSVGRHGNAQKCCCFFAVVAIAFFGMVADQDRLTEGNGVGHFISGFPKGITFLFVFFGQSFGVVYPFLASLFIIVFHKISAYRYRVRGSLVL